MRLVALLLVGCAASAVRAEPCEGQGTRVLVNSKTHLLHLCRAGKSDGDYEVALGRKGMDKRKEGDGRTPTGDYALGAPRASHSDFYRFIPISYPTAAQKRAGFTGSAVGIHGPKKQAAWLGGLTTWVDWTQGCVALAEREEIEAIEHWVRRHRVKLVSLR